MVFDLEKAREIVGAMSPTPWIVLEDRYGQIDVIRNPNHPMHKEGVIELWGMTSETATPDAIGISYMRSEFPNALDEIERLRGFETAARDLNNDLIRIAGERDELATRIQELEDALVEEGTKGLFNGPWDSGLSCGGYDEEMAACRREARRRLQAEGKIGPDAALKKQWDDVLGTKPRSWQITDGRVRAICWAEEMAGDCKAGDVLRDMLEEAGRE